MCPYTCIGIRPVGLRRTAVHEKRLSRCQPDGRPVLVDDPASFYGQKDQAAVFEITYRMKLFTGKEKTCLRTAEGLSEGKFRRCGTHPDTAVTDIEIISKHMHNLQ